MEIVRADFKKNCTVFELIEELFDDRLADYLDEYLENRDYIEDYPDHIMMSSKGNIVEFMNTNTGDKFFMGLYYRNDQRRLNLLTPTES